MGFRLNIEGFNIPQRRLGLPFLLSSQRNIGKPARSSQLRISPDLTNRIFPLVVGLRFPIPEQLNPYLQSNPITFADHVKSAMDIWQIRNIIGDLSVSANHLASKVLSNSIISDFYWQLVYCFGDKTPYVLGGIGLGFLSLLGGIGYHVYKKGELDRALKSPGLDSIANLLYRNRNNVERLAQLFEEIGQKAPSKVDEIKADFMLGPGKRNPKLQAAFLTVFTNTPARERVIGAFSLDKDFVKQIDARLADRLALQIIRVLESKNPKRIFKLLDNLASQDIPREIKIGLIRILFDEKYEHKAEFEVYRREVINEFLDDSSIDFSRIRHFVKTFRLEDHPNVLRYMPKRLEREISIIYRDLEKRKITREEAFQRILGLYGLEILELTSEDLGEFLGLLKSEDKMVFLKKVAPALIQKIDERVAIAILREMDPIAASELAERLGLAEIAREFEVEILINLARTGVKTKEQILDELEKRGIIREISKESLSSNPCIRLVEDIFGKKDVAPAEFVDNLIKDGYTPDQIKAAIIYVRGQRLRPAVSTLNINEVRAIFDRARELLRVVEEVREERFKKLEQIMPLRGEEAQRRLVTILPTPEERAQYLKEMLVARGKVPQVAEFIVTLPDAELAEVLSSWNIVDIAVLANHVPQQAARIRAFVNPERAVEELYNLPEERARNVAKVLGLPDRQLIEKVFEETRKPPGQGKVVDVLEEYGLIEKEDLSSAKFSHDVNSMVGYLFEDLERNPIETIAGFRSEDVDFGSLNNAVAVQLIGRMRMKGAVLDVEKMEKRIEKDEKMLNEAKQKAKLEIARDLVRFIQIRDAISAVKEIDRQTIIPQILDRAVAAMTETPPGREVAEGCINEIRQLGFSPQEIVDMLNDRIPRTEENISEIMLTLLGIVVGKGIQEIQADYLFREQIGADEARRRLVKLRIIPSEVDKLIHGWQNAHRGLAELGIIPHLREGVREIDRETKEVDAIVGTLRSRKVTQANIEKAVGAFSGLSPLGKREVVDRCAVGSRVVHLITSNMEDPKLAGAVAQLIQIGDNEGAVKLLASIDRRRRILVLDLLRKEDLKTEDIERAVKKELSSEAIKIIKNLNSGKQIVYARRNFGNLEPEDQREVIQGLNKRGFENLVRKMEAEYLVLLVNNLAGIAGGVEAIQNLMVALENNIRVRVLEELRKRQADNKEGAGGINPAIEQIIKNFSQNSGGRGGRRDSEKDEQLIQPPEEKDETSSQGNNPNQK